MDFTVLSLSQTGSEQPAIIIPATNYAESVIFSYNDINRSVASIQQGLARAGIGKGSKVALVLPNGLEFVTAFLAVLNQRSIAAPINPQYKQEEYNETFQLIQPSVLITVGSDSGAPSASIIAARICGIPVARCIRDRRVIKIVLEEDRYTEPVALVSICDIQPDDMALLLYTSGTTGAPKGVILTHQNILVSMKIIIQAHELSPRDRCMLITPLFHVAGLCASLLCTLFSGGCAIIPSSLAASFWQDFKDYEATWFHGVPTLHRILLSFPRPEKMPAIRFVRSGGSELSVETFRRLEEDLKAPVLEIYGLTETAPGIFCNKLGSLRRPAFFPIPSAIEVKILVSLNASEPLPILENAAEVEGEICIRGKNVMSGYVNNPAANNESFIDGFFRTGDLGVLHKDGYLQLTGRIKEVINKGGEKVSPSEIENIVLAHEAIREVACFKVQDEMYGEDIGTFCYKITIISISIYGAISSYIGKITKYHYFKELLSFCILRRR
jgi:acyl-CoA synthetase (AMP-forming)/AMP-acid ligase II